MANIIESKPQTKIYDSLFIAIFGRNTKQSKQWRLDLYNALNNRAPQTLICHSVD